MQKQTIATTILIWKYSLLVISFECLSSRASAAWYGIMIYKVRIHLQQWDFGSTRWINTIYITHIENNSRFFLRDYCNTLNHCKPCFETIKIKWIEWNAIYSYYNPLLYGIQNFVRMTKNSILNKKGLSKIGQIT